MNKSINVIKNTTLKQYFEAKMQIKENKKH